LNVLCVVTRDESITHHPSSSIKIENRPKPQSRRHHHHTEIIHEGAARVSLNADGKRTPTSRLRFLMMSKLKCIAVPVILFQLESRNRATTHFYLDLPLLIEKIPTFFSTSFSRKSVEKLQQREI
jgi:hypothetical protein